MTEFEMRALVFQHLPMEQPAEIGTNLAQRGFQLTAVELDEGEPIPDLDPFDLLIVMGGPMDVWQEDQHAWLTPEKAAIRHWVQDLGRPFLGVCLGHQLLAVALGGEVGPMAGPEVGVQAVELTSEGVDDPVMGGLVSRPDPLQVLEWHGAEVKVLPPNGQILASSPACPVQAIHVAPAAWGVQFHVEVDDELMQTWVAVPEYRAFLDATVPGGAEALSAAVRDHLPAMLGYSAGIAAQLADICAARRITGEPEGAGR